MLFMGEEWGARTPWQFFSHFPDDRAQRRGARGPALGVRRRTAGTPPRTCPTRPHEQTFLESKLDWTEPAEEPHATVLPPTGELIALRKARPELSDPWLDEVEVDVDEEARTIVLHRGGLRLAVNLGDDPVTFDLDLPVGRVLLASEHVDIDGEALTLGPQSFAIAELG